MYKEITQEKRGNLKREAYFDILSSEKKTVALVGALHTGKTMLAKEYASRGKNSVYIDLTRIGMTPEDFCVSYVLIVASWHLKRDVKILEECEINEKCQRIVWQIKNELLKIKPDHKLLVELAFTFSSTLKKEVVIDEFWRILDLNNFDAISNVLSICKSIWASSRYILVGSAQKLMKDIAKELRVEVIDVKGLKMRDVGDDEVHYYSQGIPLYAEAIQRRHRTGGDVRTAFLTECLWKQGVIYTSSLLKLNEGLARARGKGLLMSVLRVLCKSNGLRLSEISRAVYRSAAVTKNLVSRLEDVDLIVKEGNLFMFSDTILKFWFRHYVDVIEFDHVPGKNELRKIEVDL